MATGKKFKLIDGKLRRCATEPPAKSLEETIAASHAAAEKAREAERAKIGRMIPGKGIYIGTWTPKDEEGKSLGKIFNVYAAPQDLTDSTGQKSVFRYTQAVKRVSELKNWHGHNGTNYATDKEFYKALKNSNYKGGWIIPPFALLVGKDPLNNKTTQADNLLACKDKGTLKGTFTVTGVTGYTYPEWYWSSTEIEYDHQVMRTANFSNGTHSRHYKDILSLSCRPVRLEPAPL